MRIGVHERPAGQETPGSVDRGDHRVVGVPRLAVRAIDRTAGEERHLGQIDPVRADRVRHRQTVRLAELEIVCPMPRSDVDEPGALIGFDKASRQ